MNNNINAGYAGKIGKLARHAVKDAARRVLRAVDEVSEDVESVMERDPAAKNKAEVLLLYSGVHAVLAYRVAHKLQKNGFEITARAVSQGAKLLTGIEIHPGAEIGRGLFIDHGSGVVIGETAIIGDNCTIYQGVTLGGTGKQCGKRHPTLGDNVIVGAGAKLLGNFTVGDNSKIAAGAVVLKDVPANCTAVGIPAHIVKKDGEKVKHGCDLDQVHIPDPVENEIAALKKQLEALADEVKQMKDSAENNG